MMANSSAPLTRRVGRRDRRAQVRGEVKRPGGTSTETKRHFLYRGLIKLHVLHHATKEPVYGLAMIEELARHGYRLSAGTLYPVLHDLEAKGLLASRRERTGKTERRVYKATRTGRAALAEARVRVRELFGELFEDR